MPEQRRSTLWAAPVDSDDNCILLRVILAGKQPGVDEVAVAGDMNPAVRSVHEGADRRLWEEETLQQRLGHNQMTPSCFTCILFLPHCCLYTSLFRPQYAVVLQSYTYALKQLMFSSSHWRPLL